MVGLKRPLRDLKWQTASFEHSVLGKTEVTCWAPPHKIRKSYSPYDIADALVRSGLAKAALAEDSVVTLGDKLEKGKNIFVVRHFKKAASNKSVINPHQIFDSLQGTVEKHSAVVEMPFAKVVTPSRVFLITLFKKNNGSLLDYAFSRNLEKTNYLQAVISAAKQLAKLHAAGYVHGHPHAANFVLRKRKDGKLAVSLMDPKQLGNDSHAFSSESQRNADFDYFLSSSVLVPSHFNRRVARFVEENKQEIRDAYEQKFKKHKEYLAKLGKN